MLPLPRPCVTALRATRHGLLQGRQRAAASTLLLVPRTCIIHRRRAHAMVMVSQRI